jgi:predicted Zn-ribbon and HTH transcriptional regulator
MQNKCINCQKDIILNCDMCYSCLSEKKYVYSEKCKKHNWVSIERKGSKMIDNKECYNCSYLRLRQKADNCSKYPNCTSESIYENFFILCIGVQNVQNVKKNMVISGNIINLIFNKYLLKIFFLFLYFIL